MEAVLNVDNIKELAQRHPLPDPVDQADLFIDSIARRCSLGELTPVESIETWAARIGVNGAPLLAGPLPPMAEAGES